MAVITVVALAALHLLPLGFGVMVGLALFQLILLVNVARSMVKMGSGGSAQLDAASRPSGGRRRSDDA